MVIVLNGEKETLEKELTILELLEKFEFNPNIVSVALNEEILQRDDFESTTVKEGDHVDIMLFMGGGK